MIYGVRLLQALRKIPVESHLVMTRTAEVTLAHETRMKVAQCDDWPMQPAASTISRACRTSQPDATASSPLDQPIVDLVADAPTVRMTSQPLARSRPL